MAPALPQPFKMRFKQPNTGMMLNNRSKSSLGKLASPASLYLRPQDAPGWNELEEFARVNRAKLLESVRKRFILEQNHAKLVLDEYKAMTEQWKLEEEVKIAKQNEMSANMPNKRYPSRNNPAAVPIELGQEQGAAEAERRERERRKNAATLPDLEFGDEYRASVFERMQRATTDGRPALCVGRPNGSDCVEPGMDVPALIIPSPLGCNCSRAVSELKRKFWTDCERSIFLDKFLQFPKDFKRIASFLKAKSTEDVIAFYYDTKKACDYKSYLNEHYRRRNRDQSELVGVRELYLAKLGVKLPLCQELDGIRRYTPRKAEKPIPPLSRLPCILVSHADMFPKHIPPTPGANPVREGGVGDVYPYPAIVAEFSARIESADLQSFLLRSN
jgi:hypothetical protein